jgi:cytochrome b6-f complex iron-sulfur subunit
MATVTTSAAPGISRREFLYYIWGASIALITLQATGLLVWYLLPRFREGEFGGTFTLPVDAIPPTNSTPIPNAEGRFWLSNLDSQTPNNLMYRAEGEKPIVGVVAIYKVCTHLGCIYDWNSPNSRFECPCHGSKYRLDGRRIQDPAPRNLGRFAFYALDENEQVIAKAEPNDDGFSPLILPEGTAYVRIDTGDLRPGETQVLLSDVPAAN